MYLHIGKDIMIKLNCIIGIFNIKSIKKTEEYKKIYKKLKEKNKIMDISDDSKKTIILIKENNELIGYISNISSLTLLKRV